MAAALALTTLCSAGAMAQDDRLVGARPQYTEVQTFYLIAPKETEQHPIQLPALECHTVIRKVDLVPAREEPFYTRSLSPAELTLPPHHPKPPAGPGTYNIINLGF